MLLPLLVYPTPIFPLPLSIAPFLIHIITFSPIFSIELFTLTTPMPLILFFTNTIFPIPTHSSSRTSIMAFPSAPCPNSQAPILSRTIPQHTSIWILSMTIFWRSSHPAECQGLSPKRTSSVSSTAHSNPLPLLSLFSHRPLVNPTKSAYATIFQN